MAVHELAQYHLSMQLGNSLCVVLYLSLSYRDVIVRKRASFKEQSRNALCTCRSALSEALRYLSETCCIDDFGTFV